MQTPLGLKSILWLTTSLFLTLLPGLAPAQTGKDVYQEIKGFSLNGGKAEVANLIFKRDRVEMALTGTIYFATPVNGRVTGAVFIGQGSFKATVPAIDFERSYVKRLVGVDDVLATDFKTAVFRFSDDSMSQLGIGTGDGIAPPQFQALALESDKRAIKQTGANIAARLAVSILNGENPGVFYVSIDGGKLGKLNFLFDPTNRLIADYFHINAGERGVIFRYVASQSSNEVLMAFHSLGDYSRGIVEYSDQNNLIDTTNYGIEIDLTDPNKNLGENIRLAFQSTKEQVKAIPFLIGESLDVAENERLKKQMKLKSAKLNGAEIEFAQEDWEGGFTLFFPKTLPKGTPLELLFELNGDYLREIDSIECWYPLSNSDWYPRHGYLDRSTFDITFRHNKKLKVASIGLRQKESPADNGKDLVVTTYAMKHEVPLATFALGQFTRHSELIKWDKGGEPTPLEYNSLDFVEVNEPLIMAEMNNAIRYFHSLFGKYPYDSFSAAYHPFGFGQGFPSMLVIPPTNQDTRGTFAFISHETAHQWWGDLVTWRSYRDQWLSEGFAEYSGVIYLNHRKNPAEGRKLVESMRKTLREPPMGEYTLGTGKLDEVGPLTLGHRLATRKTRNAYSDIVYSKGGLVLRMLHFMFTDPSTGDGQRFYDMLKDFVDRYKNRAASTENFRAVVNEHFAATPIAKTYGLADLNWFFNQWVFHTGLPTYKLEYKIADGQDGSIFLTCNVIQEGVPQDWAMVLPITIKFPGNKFALTTVGLKGSKGTFRIKLPARPEKVELDPDHWILSEKTSTQDLR